MAVAGALGGDWLVAAAATTASAAILYVSGTGCLDRGDSRMLFEADMRRHPRLWTAYMLVAMSGVAFLVPYLANRRDVLVWVAFGVAVGIYGAWTFHRRITEPL